MKRTLQGLLGALGLIVGLSSCQEPAAPSVRADQPRGTLLSFTEQSQACNAYDWFGWFHNQAMAYGLTYKNDYLVVAPVTASYMVGDFLVDYNLSDAHDTSQVYPIAFRVDSIHQAVNNYVAGKTRAQIVAGLPFSTASKTIVAQLFDGIDHAYDRPFLLKCDTLVADVLGNSQIDSSEKVILQSVIAVAYHSFQFWDYYYQDGDLQSSRIPFLAQAPNQPKTESVVEADAVGAVVGAGIGAAGGAATGAVLGTTVGAALTGPAGGSGAAPGAVLGATFGFFRGAIGGFIAGALAGSAYKGIVEPMLDEDRNESGEPKKKERVGP